MHLRLAVLLAVFCLTACNSKKSAPRAGADTTDQPAGEVLELVFSYGSEKEEWIKECTAAFHARAPKTTAGKAIKVLAIAQGSGDCIEEAISGSPRKVHLTSPASEAYVKIGNARWASRAAGKELIAKTENLVLSPVVIAMWRPMAEALGWPQKAIGWSDILSAAQDPRGWSAYGQAQWGRFKFGHTHPEYSNSGLISVLAEAYAATGKREGLNAEALAQPSVRQTLLGIEQSVVHYGSSTGFFARKMFANGPAYLSAAVLYENNVIEANDAQRYPDLAFPVVAIYPKEGTFWSDHPIGVVEREWVTAEHRDAARQYIDFLLARPQQERALSFGFRPAAVDVPIAAPISTASGVDPKEPKTTLAVPPADVMDAALALWRETKKTSSVSLVMDVSGSMRGSRIKNAREGGRQLVANLSARDRFSLLTFSSAYQWLFQDVPLSSGRERAQQAIGGLIEGGGTALYDAIAEAYRAQTERQRADPARIGAIVVLTDGEDTDSRLKLEGLLQRIRFDSERQPVRIFTIGYGEQASEKALKAIADATQGRFYKGTPENIGSVFRDIATFF
ncbi:MAG: VWA domain-containing protein [Verrucomicrobia bacterium]|nr:VWA domain-containing protein [Verrucomicrobiota bacterium]